MGDTVSADNYLAVWKSPDGKYRGYMRFASGDEDTQVVEPVGTARPIFVADTLEKMISCVKHEERKCYYEYGVSFMNFGDEEQS